MFVVEGVKDRWGVRFGGDDAGSSELTEDVSSARYTDSIACEVRHLPPGQRHASSSQDGEHSSPSPGITLRIGFETSIMHLPAIVCDLGPASILVARLALPLASRCTAYAAVSRWPRPGPVCFGLRLRGRRIFILPSPTARITTAAFASA